MSLFQVANLSVEFVTPRGPLRAVRDLSFELDEGETVGLVGESGSGKSASALAIMGLLPASARIDIGRLQLEGQDLLSLDPRERRKRNGRDLAIVFQDPRSAVNPFLTIGSQMSEVLEVHRGLRLRAARERCAAALGEVGIADPERVLRTYPHELSGGTLQRILIATALLCGPRVLIADEPTTALDATLQAQVLELLQSYQRKSGAGIVLITHDLGVVARFAARVLILYNGTVVESADAQAIFARPLHPYTIALLRSAPHLDGDLHGRLPSIHGVPPDPMESQESCAFAPRCDFAQPRCYGERPLLTIWRGETEGRSLRGRRCACFELERVEIARAAGEIP